jgi:holo-[acyl-carrier protein] synthase
MILAVGIDVASIDRMKTAVSRHGERFVARLFSPEERAIFAGREGRALFATLAGRFAAKEAWSKCLDGARGVPWHDVQVLANPSGRPRIEVRGQAAERCATLGVVRAHLSITHDAGVAAAVVVLEGA